MTAQTNLQLYNQLASNGFKVHEIQEVDAAYGAALRLFTGRYRANGKPFSAHLVGTASILARHGASLDVIIAGLLHATYLQGEFGSGKPGASPQRRRWMREYVSNEVDDLLVAYAQFPWKPKHLAQLAPEVTSLPEHTRKVLFIRLANALEDQLDFASQFSAKKHRDDSQAKSREEWGIEIGIALGHDALAGELKVEMNKVAWTGAETLKKQASGSFVLAPRSHRVKCSPGLRFALRKAVQRLKAVNFFIAGARRTTILL
jgi:hypothetical protein